MYLDSACTLEETTSLKSPQKVKKEFEIGEDAKAFNKARKLLKNVSQTNKESNDSPVEKAVKMDNALKHLQKLQ